MKNRVKKIIHDYIDIMVPFYNDKPGGKELIGIHTNLLNNPMQLFRYVKYCAYTNNKHFFCDGKVWPMVIELARLYDIKLPPKMTKESIEYDKRMSDHLEGICNNYLPYDFKEQFKNDLPIERRTFYYLYVPAMAFTEHELKYMKKSPLWQLVPDRHPKMINK